MTDSSGSACDGTAKVRSLTFTAGAGKINHQGQRVTIEDQQLVRAFASKGLETLPHRKESWWSPTECADDYLNTKNWRSACAGVVDIDYHDEQGQHSEVPEASAMALAKHAAGGALPGNLFHATPRGARIVFVFDRQCTDQATVKAALRGGSTLVTEALKEAALLGFKVDPASNKLAQFYYGPRAIVRGTARDAAVLVMREQPHDIHDLAARAPREQRSRVARNEGAEFDDAVQRWNAAHPLTLPRSDGECPACGCCQRRSVSAGIRRRRFLRSEFGSSPCRVASGSCSSGAARRRHACGSQGPARTTPGPAGKTGSPGH